MSDTIAIHKNMGSLDVSPEFDGFSKVIIHTSDTETGQAGNDSGRTLEFDNPYADGQTASRNAIAKDILNRLQNNGVPYQPYTADDAVINPAAEIGDAISSPLVYGGIYTRTKTFGHLMLTNASAPHDEEINHEYQYESPEVREFKRQNDLLRASLTVTNSAITSEVERAQGAESSLASSIEQTAGEISAKVSSTGGSGSTFGWKLDSEGFYLYSKNTTVLSCTQADGLVVNGNVAADSGTIGDFTIKNGALFTNNMETMQSTQSSGVHLSKNGLKIGGNVSITPNGIITANSMKLKGTIAFLNADGSSAGTLSAANLKTGAEQAYNNHGTWTTGSGYGYNYNNATTDNSGKYPTFFKVNGPIYAETAFHSASYLVSRGTDGSGYPISDLELANHKHYISADAKGKVTIGGPVPSTSGNVSFNIAETSFYQNGVSAAIRNVYVNNFYKLYESGGYTYFYIEMKNTSDTSFLKGVTVKLLGSFN